MNNLKEISIAGASFSLPESSEFEELLGGEGNCVSVGYSLVSTEENDGLLIFFCVILLHLFNQSTQNRGPNCLIDIFFYKLLVWRMVCGNNYHFVFSFLLKIEFFLKGAHPSYSFSFIFYYNPN